MKFEALPCIGATALVVLFVLPARADSTSESLAMTPRQEAGAVAPPAKEAVVTIGPKHANTTVSIDKGGSLQVRLASNPTTGFRWHVGTCNTEILRQAGKAVYEYPTAGLLGAGGTELFTFTAINAGTTALTLEYTRPSGKSKADKSYEVNVSVKGP